MSQQPAKPKRQIRVNFERFRSASNSGMVGMPEIIGLGGSLFVLVMVIVSYFYFFVPAKANLASATQEQARLKTLLSSSRQVVQQGQTTEATVKKITESLEDFETTGLNERTQGRMDLYDELNELIRKNGLRNTAGPAYTVLDPVGTKSATTKSANTKWQSVYPGIAINLTVEGQYANLRRFVRDIEASKVFLIVNAVELERATEHNAIAAEGSARASLVSLRLDMATYFQRSGIGGAAEQTGN